MQEIDSTKNNIDSVRLNALLGAKDTIDRDVRQLFERYAFFRDKITITPEAKLFDMRFVAVSMRSKMKTFIEKINRQREINEELLEVAPMYFSKGSDYFKQATILENVTSLHITTNTAVNSQKKTGLQLARRAERLMQRTERQIETAVDQDDVAELKDQLAVYQQEYSIFSSQPEKIYRLRTDKHKDVVAIYRRAGDQTVSKIRVGGGGLLVLKARMASEDNFKIQAAQANYRSIYDDVEPLPNRIGLSGKLYEESQLELVREHHRRKRGTNENKIRPQGEDPVV